MGGINGSVNNFLENLCLWFVNEKIFFLLIHVCGSDGPSKNIVKKCGSIQNTIFLKIHICYLSFPLKNSNLAFS